MGPDWKNQRKESADISITKAFATYASNLYGVLGGSSERLIYSVTVTRRAQGDWLCVCKVTKLPEMEKLIAFGAGGTWASALTGLNASISAGKWRPDKPWDGKRK